MANMLTYWDLEEKQRAALSANDVERFIDAELMTKGVLRVTPVELAPEPTPPEHDMTVFIATSPSYGRTVCFPSAEAFESAKKLGMQVIVNAYLGGETVYYAEGIEKQPEVRACYSHDAYNTHRRALEQYGSAKKANEEARKSRAEAIKAQDEALRGLWDDWNRCRSLDGKMRKIGSTFAEYTVTAGDASTAEKFLRKVFVAADIEDAAKWCGFELPSATPQEAEAAQ